MQPAKQPAKQPADPAARAAHNAQWWHKAVIYENHLPSFRDGDGDGIGDLAGLTQSLDYLADTLGVDSVWVGPCYESPLLDNGYDISDHCAVEPVFGDLDTLDRLLSEAHRRGMKILLDYVPNHTSDQHPWFVESRSSRDNPRRDWYVWRDPRPDGGPPNNWTSEAGGSVWEFDPHTGQCYLHSHLVEQPDLNWRDPAVRTAMYDVLRFWLDRGVDGFRIDVAHLLMKDPQFRDNPPDPAGRSNPYDIQHPDFATQLHVHDRLHPDTHMVLREIRGVIDSYPDRVIVGEIEAMAWPEWAAFFGTDLDELHLPFAFRLIETPWEPALLAAEIGELETAVPAGGWPVLALGNHDRPRLATRLGRAQARVAAVLLLTLRGTPSMFYGDELGLLDQPVPRERQRDYFARATGGVSRDPTRTPMPWDGQTNSGYSTAPADDLWLPVCGAAETINVEAQLGDADSHLSLYRRLLTLRRGSPALHGGSYDEISSSGRCLVYQRLAGGDRKVIALNLTGQPAQVELPAAGPVVLSTHLHREGRATGTVLELAADEAVVIDAPRDAAT